MLNLFFESFFGSLADQFEQARAESAPVLRDDFTSPIEEFIGPGFKAENIDVEFNHGDGCDYIIIAAEEKPYDVVGAKLRRTFGIPLDVGVTDITYNETTGWLRIYLIPLDPIRPEIDVRAE